MPHHRVFEYGLAGVCGLAVAMAAGVVSVASLDAAQAAPRLVYVGTYTNDHSQGIYSARFDQRTGALTAVKLAARTTSPSFLTASADGRFLFAVNETQTYGGEATGSVTSFAVNRATGGLTALSMQASRGTDPCHLALDRTGHFLAVANYSSGTVAVLRVGTDGKLSPAVTVIQHAGRGPNTERQEGPHAHQVVFSRDNTSLMVVDLGADRIFVYDFDATTGGLTPHAPAFVSLAPGAGPRHLAVAADERHAYVINELASTITTLAWAAPSGTFTPGASVSTLPRDFTGTSTTAEILVHPSGRLLYGSNRGHDSLAIFQIGADGALHSGGFASTRGRTPRHFAFSPDGRWLLAANQDSGDIGVFRIDLQSGALAPVGRMVSAGTPVCVLFMN